MNWIDIVILCICSLLFLLGLKRGLIDQIFSAAAIVGGILCALIFYEIAGDLLIRNEVFENRSIANITGFLAILVLSYIVIQIFGWLTSKLVGTLKLGWINRISGGALGLLIGILVSSLFISAVNLFSDDKNTSVKRSLLEPYITKVYGTIKDTVPDDLKREYEEARKLIMEKGFKEASGFKDKDNGEVE